MRVELHRGDASEGMWALTCVIPAAHMNFVLSGLTSTFKSKRNGTRLKKIKMIVLNEEKNACVARVGFSTKTKTQV